MIDAKPGEYVWSPPAIVQTKQAVLRRQFPIEDLRPEIEISLLHYIRHPSCRPHARM